MRKNTNNTIHILTLCLVLALSPALMGQALEINGFAGWQLAGKANLYDGEFKIDDAMNYGGRVSVGLSTTTFAEITYLRYDTEGRFFEYGTFFISNPIPISSNYILISGLQEMHFGPVSPFISIGAGLTVWSPKTSQLNSKTQFSASLGGGLKIWLTDFLGIRLQGSMLMPMVFDGFGFGCGIGTSGSTCSSNVYTRITPFQGEFSGGLVIKLMPN